MYWACRVRFNGRFDEQPLQGLRVVALEQAVAAPFCSRQLADMGADVIKVERPNGGDFARSYDGALHGMSAYFDWLNRGKRSIVLDLKRTEDYDVCSELIACADIFIHNLAFLCGRAPLGRIPARVGMRHNMIVPYGAYRCADGLVNFAIQNEREWSRFCNLVLQLPSLVNDERFASNTRRLESRTELETLIEQQFASLIVSEVLTRLNHADIANSAVNDVQAVANHAQLAARGRWMNVPSPNGMIPALLPPHNLMS